MRLKITLQNSLMNSKIWIKYIKQNSWKNLIFRLKSSLFRTSLKNKKYNNKMLSKCKKEAIITLLAQYNLIKINNTYIIVIWLLVCIIKMYLVKKHVNLNFAILIYLKNAIQLKVNRKSEYNNKYTDLWKCELWEDLGR